MKKRLLSLLLALCMLLSVVPAVFADSPEDEAAALEAEIQANMEAAEQEENSGVLEADTVLAASSGKCGSNLTWSYNNGTLTISGTGEMNYGDTRPWGASISMWAKKIVISSGVTSIADNAFHGFYDVTSVSIPGTVKTIGYHAFFCCFDLTSITIPYGVTTIGSGAFGGCEKFTSVSLPSSLTSIGSQAFFDCYELASVEIPDSVKTIENSAFSGCRKLTSVSLPKGLTFIESCLFEGCTNLTSVYIPASVTSIGNSVFKDTALTDIYYGGTAESWAQIKKGYNNDELNAAAVHYGISANFTDVKNPSEYYYAPVYWAVGRSITEGTGDNKFSPEDPCTRAQVVTFLWRTAGKPEPKTTTSPFTDVKDSGMWYYKAVLWAAENKITTGETATTFAPDNPCTRAQIVTFLWRYAGEPQVGAKNPFTDVNTSEYYASPVLWAVRKEITKGTSATTFEPDTTCTRAQVVTFLYRYAAK